jgi:hypothetical protein
MQDDVPKNKFPPKPTFPQKNKEAKPFQKDWVEKPRLDEETRRELRKKKLCFSCQEPWVLGHRCSGKDKVGKAHYIEVYSDSDNDEEDEGPRYKNRDTRHQVRRHHRLGLKVMLWHPCQDFLGTTHSESEESCKGHKVTMLIDSGASHNFIDASLVDRREILTEEFEGFTVIIPGGYQMECTRWIPKLKITMGNYTLTDDFFVVDVSNTNVVLRSSVAILHWELHY